MSLGCRLLVIAFCAVVLVGGLARGDLVRNEGLRAALAAEALATGNWLVPTIHGEPHLAWHLTYKVKGKTRTVYVPLDLLDEVRSWLAEHKRIKTQLDEIHQLTVALIRTHAKHQKRKAGRV